MAELTETDEIWLVSKTTYMALYILVFCAFMKKTNPRFYFGSADNKIYAEILYQVW